MLTNKKPVGLQLMSYAIIAGIKVMGYPLNNFVGAKS